MRNILAFVLALCPSFTSSAGAQDVTPPKADGQVLMLLNERGLEGAVERVGDRFRVRRGTSEVWVPVEKALRVCTDWDDAYEFMKKRVNLGDPDERLRLARWCQLHSLRAQALNEAQAALDMRPAHVESRKLVAMLKQVTATGTQASTTPAKTPVPPPKAKTPAQAADISSDAFAIFATRVQPILMNTCVTCHSGGRGGEFQLIPTDGSQRGVTQANLAAVLDQVRPDNLVLSPLFIKAVSRHGNAASAPIKDRQAVPFKTMHVWVEFLLTTNPHLKFREPEAVAGAPKKSEATAFAQGRTEPPLLEAPRAGTVSKGVAAAPIPPPPVAAAGGRDQTQTTSSDPFDPEIFNRQSQARVSKRD